ncbi:MAG: PepSY-like domain-containing protein [Tannerellaceae bacterium]|jgi:hypothetical protein|nr:PepSY-like domain-containing protein [Tannerellaceae bacterium]
MKHYFYARTLAAGLLLLTFVNCSEESTGNGDGTSGNPIVPGEQVLRSFEDRYPEATQVVWDIEEGYYVADFAINSQMASAWFGTNGEWRQGKIPASYHGEIEPVVSEAFAHTAYAKWEIKEAYTLNRRELMSVYAISVTNKEILSNLYFTRYGDLIKVIDDVHYRIDVPITIPSALLSVVNKLFASVEIVDMTIIDVINSEISVGLVEEEIYLTAIFDKNYAWIVSFWNLTQQTLPPVVWNGFQASAYSGHTLSRIRKMQTATASTYLFYLIKDNKTMIAEFNSLGQLTSIVSRNHIMAKYLFLR